MSITTYFVTLTYEDSYLPRTDDGTPIVDVRDTQLFFKRLRKKMNVYFPGQKIRYFLVSEYGPETLRPHYHLILFNLPIKNPADAEKFLESVWSQGFVTVGEPTPKRLNYVAAYCIQPKQQFKDKGLVPVFNTMSRNPGIGASYIDKYKEYHTGKNIKNDKVRDFNFREYRLPRYMRDRGYSDADKRAYKRISEEMVERCDQRYTQRLTELGMSDSDYKRQEWSSGWKSIVRSLKLKKL